MLVARDGSLRTSSVTNRNRHDLGVERTAFGCSLAFYLRRDCEAVLLQPRYTVTLRDLFGSLAQRDRPLGGHGGIDHSPSQDRIEELLLPPERRIALWENVGRARHRLDSAGDHNVAFAARNRRSGGVNCLKARTAEPIDRRAGNFDRESSKQRRHPRDVAIILTALIGGAEIDVVDRRRRNRRTFDDCTEHDRRQIVGTDARERSAIPSDWSADRVDHPDVAIHCATSSAAGSSATSSVQSARCGANSSPCSSASRFKIRRMRAPPISRPHSIGPIG